MITGLAVGGAEKALVDLSKEGISKGHDISIVSLTPVCGQFIERFDGRIKIIEVNLLGILGKIRAFKCFKKVVLQFRPDVIHAHMVHANIFVLVCSIFRLINAPVVITAHSVDEGRLSFMYKFLARASDHCVHISSLGLKIYNRKGYFPSKKSSFIPNGTRIYTKSAKAMNLGNPVRFVAVGRLAPEKNYSFMIKAMQQLKSDGNPFSLSILGDGPLRSELEGLIISEGLSDNVKIEGVVNNVREMLELSDFFLMSSHFEGMPMSLLEACEVGLPSLVTDVGSCKEVTLGLPHCYAVRPDDISEYVTALRSLLKVDQRGYSLGVRKIRQRAVESYSVGSSFMRLEKIYSKVAPMIGGN